MKIEIDRKLLVKKSYIKILDCLKYLDDNKIKGKFSRRNKIREEFEHVLRTRVN